VQPDIVNTIEVLSHVRTGAVNPTSCLPGSRQDLGNECDQRIPPRDVRVLFSFLDGSQDLAGGLLGRGDEQPPDQRRQRTLRLHHGGVDEARLDFGHVDWAPALPRQVPEASRLRVTSPSRQPLRCNSWARASPIPEDAPTITAVRRIISAGVRPSMRRAPEETSSMRQSARDTSRWRW